MVTIKAVIFDMDGTLVQYDGPFQSSWDAIGYREIPELIEKFG